MSLPDRKEEMVRRMLKGPHPPVPADWRSARRSAAPGFGAAARWPGEWCGCC